LNDSMPVGTSYKGVAIFANQPSKRVALVKKEIDTVSKIVDLLRLFEIAGDCSWSPESRLFSAARCVAGLQILTERRETRPDLSREGIEARVGGLNSLTWAHPLKYCSLLDPHDERAVTREVPLDDSE
jgi:hypothetical protein